MRRGVGDAEIERHAIEEDGLGQRRAAGPEIGADLERQAVASDLERRAFQQRAAGASVSVQRELAQQQRRVALQAVQRDAHAGRGATVHRVEDVRGQETHRTGGVAGGSSIVSGFDTAPMLLIEYLA